MYSICCNAGLIYKPYFKPKSKTPLICLKCQKLAEIKTMGGGKITQNEPEIRTKQEEIVIEDMTETKKLEQLKGKTYTYRLRKAPFNCSTIVKGQEGMCIALPEKHRKKYDGIKVMYQGENILNVPSEKWMKMSLAHRHQPDKFHGGTFLMSYFKLQ